MKYQAFMNRVGNILSLVFAGMASLIYAMPNSDAVHQDGKKLLSPDVPVCAAPDYVKDAWLLRVSDADTELKEKLFTILKLASVKGFGINTAAGSAADSYLALYLYFNENAFIITNSDNTQTLDTKTASIFRTKVLNALAEVIEPAKLECIMIAQKGTKKIGKDYSGAEMASASALPAMGRCSMDNLDACIDPTRAGGVTGSNGCRIDENKYLNPDPRDTYPLPSDLEDALKKILQ